MKILHKEIRSCQECPYRRYREGHAWDKMPFMCSKIPTVRPLEEDYHRKSPEWCGLPDVWKPPSEPTLDEHGQAICPHCSRTTNKAYSNHPHLICWNCGGEMWDRREKANYPAWMFGLALPIILLFSMPVWWMVMYWAIGAWLLFQVWFVYRPCIDLR